MRKFTIVNSRKLLLVFYALALSFFSSAQYTIFRVTDTPAIRRTNDGGGGIEVGTKFKSTVSGTITAIRYYKGAGMTGTREGHLWDASGNLLDSAIFSSETDSGWQQASLSAPVSITANTTYIVSCFSSSGDYAITNPYFTQRTPYDPLYGVEDNMSVGNGVYAYTNVDLFPSNNFATSNYWVDVVGTFTDAVPPASPVICYAGRTSTSIKLKIAGSTDNFSVITSYEIYNGGTWLASVPYNSNPEHIYAATGLSASTSYTSINVKAKDLATNLSAASNSFSKSTLPVHMRFDEGFEDSCVWAPFYTTQDNLGQNGNTWARQKSDTTANEGTYSFRAEVRDGCDGCKSSGYRSEILPVGVTDSGKMWYGFSVYFKAPDSSGIWNAIKGLYTQWHPANDTGSSSLSLWAVGSPGGWNLQTNPSGGRGGTDHPTYDPITTNTWHHVVLYVDWDSTNGRVKGWIDGDMKWDIGSLPWNSEGRYLKMGMNRLGSTFCGPCGGNTAPEDTWIIYYDNLRIGDSAAGYNGVAPIADTTAPSSFTLSTTGQTTSTIGLSWTEATDNSENVSYEVYLNGAYVATTTGLTYELTGLSACTEYTIYIKAEDPSENFTNSNSIKPATKCTPACVTIVSYDAASGDEDAVHELTNVPSGALLVVACQTETHSGDADVYSEPELTWTKRVDAEASSSGDAEIWTAVYTTGGAIRVTADFGNNKHSSVCYVIRNQELTLGGATASDVLQSAPSVDITTTRANSIIIGGISDWNADDGTPRTYETAVTETFYRHVSSGFTSYNFYKSTTTATTYTAGVTLPDNQAAGTTLYEIRCPEAETTAPTPPVLCIIAKTHTTLTIAEGTAATDNVGVTGYVIYVEGSSPITTLSLPYTITGLTAGTPYNIYVRVRDASGNISAASATITGLTLATHVLFDEGFEGCAPWANWSTTQDAGHAWSRQQSSIKASEGIHSFRAEVRSECDGYVSSGYRSEILPADITDEGIMWYGLSIYLDEPYSGADWTGSYHGTILQWNPDGTPGSAVLALVGSEGEWNLMTNPGGYYDTRHHSSGVDITRGWHHIVFKVNWSDGGYVKVWIDGDLMFDLTDGVNSTWFNPEDLDWDTDRYLKVGMSRWGNCNTSGCPSGSQGPCDTWILYYDNIRIGDEDAIYDDVAPLALGAMEKGSFNPEQMVTAQPKPDKYSLGQNYPNPVTGQTMIPFTLPQAEEVNLVLFDQSGRLARILARGSFAQGNHLVSFDRGLLSAGIYYYKIQAGNFTSVKKLIIH